MIDHNKIHWAGKVSRRDIQRVYEFEAQDLLDEDLLDKVMYTIHARVCDMFEVMEAQKFGRVKCRSCGVSVPQPFWMGERNKDNEDRRHPGGARTADRSPLYAGVA
jgi:hypothetical protein